MICTCAGWGKQFCAFLLRCFWHPSSRVGRLWPKAIRWPLPAWVVPTEPLPVPADASGMVFVRRQGVPDLRVGDELEVAFTVRTGNPTLGTNDAGVLFFQSSPAPGSIHLELNWEKKTPDIPSPRLFNHVLVPAPIEGKT